MVHDTSYRIDKITKIAVLIIVHDFAIRFSLNEFNPSYLGGFFFLEQVHWCIFGAGAVALVILWGSQQPRWFLKNHGKQVELSLLLENLDNLRNF